MEGPRRTPSAARRRASRRALPAVLAAVTAATALLAIPVGPFAPLAPAPAASAATWTDPYFRESTVFSGLTLPMTVRFATDGRAFVAEKSGLIRAYSSISDTTATTVVDLRADVNSYWDRGVLGIALDPAFLTGRPYLYVFYVFDAPVGTANWPASRWNDVCPASPDGPGGTLDGCPVYSRLERLTIDPATNAATARTVLVKDTWCQQFPSHSGGGIAFGPDGQLYVAGGEGASFSAYDYGQKGGTVPDYTSPYVRLNPCADPVEVTSAPGTAPTIRQGTAEGGALRSQDLRTTGDPVGLSGSLIRVNPDTGAPSTGNPLAAMSDANGRRTVAIGLRNPFRATFRPGTGELYIGNVGDQKWEAIERFMLPGSAQTPTTITNYGWPCYEGPGPNSAWQTISPQLCDDLYAQGPAAVTPAVYQYSHWTELQPTGPCFVPQSNGKMGSAIAGLAFYQGAKAGTGTTPYPSKYQGGLFFVDYSRDCLAFLPRKADGTPDGTRMQQVASGLANPVDLVTGPGGDLYYVDIDGGRVVRIRYILAPVAKATATPSEARAPVTVRLDGSGSIDPDANATLDAWSWDLDGDGQYDDATGARYDWAVTTPAVYTVGLQVHSTNGLTDTVTVRVDATNDPPVPAIATPAASLTWAVGDTIAFSGGAADTEDGTVAAGGLSWDVVMMHCPADCHEHIVQTIAGVASGSFSAPDHEYPSHLELRLHATDSHGTTVTTTVALQPKTTTVSVTSTPSGVPILVGGASLPTPAGATVLLNGTVTVSAPTTATVAGTRYRFSTWADSRERVRDVVASKARSLAATFVPDAPDTCAAATTSIPLLAWQADRASGGADEDWFRFSLGSARRVVITLGNQPVNGRLELYGSCGALLATSDRAGVAYEELTRVLAAGTYRIRVRANGDAWSASAYAVRVRAMGAGIPVKSARVASGAGGGGSVRIVGELLNNTGATRGQATVTATFRSAAGATVGKLTGTGFARRWGDGAVTSFVLLGSVPAYATVTYSTTSLSAPTVPTLSLASLTLTVNTDGTVTERGSVRNAGTRTSSSTAVARSWYGSLGQLLERRLTAVSPATLAPGASGSFTITRPVLAGVQATATQLRGS